MRTGSATWVPRPSPLRVVRPVVAVGLAVLAAGLLLWLVAVAAWLRWFTWTSQSCAGGQCRLPVSDELRLRGAEAVEAAGGDALGWLAPGYFPVGFVVLVTAVVLAAAAMFAALPVEDGEVSLVPAARWVPAALGGLLALTLVVSVVALPALAWFDVIAE